MAQSIPSPLWGGIKGGGGLAAVSGLPHPLPTSPIEGEVPPGGWGWTVPQSADNSPRVKPKGDDMWVGELTPSNPSIAKLPSPALMAPSR